LPTGSGSVRLWLLALFLVDLVLLAFVPALGRCIHLSARLARLDWRSGGGTARDAIVGRRVELVLDLGFLLVLGEDSDTHVDAATPTEANAWISTTWIRPIVAERSRRKKISKAARTASSAQC
jgi:hypothetical protein